MRTTGHGHLAVDRLARRGLYAGAYVHGAETREGTSGQHVQAKTSAGPYVVYERKDGHAWERGLAVGLALGLCRARLGAGLAVCRAWQLAGPVVGPTKWAKKIGPRFGSVCMGLDWAQKKIK